jgi:hypothetical protein
VLETQLCHKAMIHDHLHAESGGHVSIEQRKQKKEEAEGAAKTAVIMIKLASG